MNGLKVTLLAGAAMLAMAGGASAVTISGGSASISNTKTDYNTPLLGNLTKFDTNLGTLNSITFTYSFGFTSTITVVANTNATGDTRTESGAQFSSADSGINSVLNSLVNTTSVSFGTDTLNPAAYDILGVKRSYNQAAGTTVTYSSNSSPANSITALTTNISSNFAPFEDAGGSAFVISARTLTGTTGSTTGGNADITQQTFANQGFSISYDYTAAPTPPPTGVPEPASLALLGAGLVGLGMIRRKAA